jgi:hypothetical protein
MWPNMVMQMSACPAACHCLLDNSYCCSGRSYSILPPPFCSLTPIRHYLEASAGASSWGSGARRSAAVWIILQSPVSLVLHVLHHAGPRVNAAASWLLTRFDNRLQSGKEHRLCLIF